MVLVVFLLFFHISSGLCVQILHLVLTSRPVKMYKIVLLFWLVQVVISNKWHKIFLEKIWIHSSGNFPQKTFSIQSENVLHIMQVVSQFPTGTLACVKSSNELTVSKYRISPYYLNQTTDTYLCYTKIPKDYAFRSVKRGREKGPSRTI